MKKLSIATSEVHSRNTSRENKPKINSMIKSDDNHQIKIARYQSKKNIMKASPAANNVKSNANLFSLKAPLSKQPSPQMGYMTHRVSEGHTLGQDFSQPKLTNKKPMKMFR